MMCALHDKSSSKKTLFLFSFPSTISHILPEVSMAKFCEHPSHLSLLTLTHSSTSVIFLLSAYMCLSFLFFVFYYFCKNWIILFSNLLFLLAQMSMLIFQINISLEESHITLNSLLIIYFLDNICYYDCLNQPPIDNQAIYSFVSLA